MYRFTKPTTYVCLSGDFQTTDRHKLVTHHNRTHKEYNPMSHTFSDEAKAFDGGSNDYLPFGVSEVKLVGVTAVEGADATKADFLELTVTNDDGIEDTARLYFSEKAEKYSFATIKGIVVHNVKEADKEKARMSVENCADLDELADLINKRTAGGTLWITKYYDPNRNYINSQGASKRSINTNVFSYQPKPNDALLALQQLGADTIHPVSDKELDSAGDGVSIPSEWDD